MPQAQRTTRILLATILALGAAGASVGTAAAGSGGILTPDTIPGGVDAGLCTPAP